MSIRTKFVLIISIVIIVGFGFSLILNDISISKNTRILTEEKLKEKCLSYIKNFNEITDMQVANGKALARFGESYYQMIKAANKNFNMPIEKYMYSQIKDNDKVYGGGIWFEKGLISGYDFYAIYTYRDKTNIVVDTQTYMNYDYTQDDWYQMAVPKNWDRNSKRDLDFYVSAPYFYPENFYDDPLKNIPDIIRAFQKLNTPIKGEQNKFELDIDHFLNMLYITVDVIMYSDNRIIGLSSSDLTLGFIPSLVSDFKITKNSEIFFIDPKTKRHIYNKDKDIIFRPFIKDDSILMTGTFLNEKNELVSKKEEFEEKAIIPWIDKVDFNIENDKINILQNIKINGKLNTIYYGKTNFGFIFGFIVPNDEAYRTMNMVKLTFRISFIIVFIIIFIVLSILVTTIIKPLSHASKSLLMISEGEGDLTQRLLVKTNDEVGVLSESFNKFLEKLNNLILKIKNTVSLTRKNTDSLASNAEEISSAIHEINSTTNFLAGKFENLANEMQKSRLAMNQLNEFNSNVVKLIDSQSAATTESFAAIEQLLTSIQNISNMAEEKKKLSNDLISQAEQGKENMKNTLEGIQSIARSAKIIVDLIKVINDIADKTNLLAMNAAIEAAHAGDSGKGFAVVADEIRKLSDMTSKNAKDVSGSLQQIINDIKNTEIVTNKTNDSINQIMKGISEITNAMTEILSAMQESSLASKHINEALSNLLQISERVRTSSIEMSKNLGDIDNMFTKVSDLSQENLIGLKEINESIREISESFANLTKLSSLNMISINEVASDISKFKVKEDSSTNEIKEVEDKGVDLLKQNAD